MLISLILYFIKIKYFNSSSLISHRNYETLGSFDGFSFFALVKDAYLRPLLELFWLSPVYISKYTVDANFVVITNICCTIFIFYSLCKFSIERNINRLNKFFLFLIILIIPLAMNFLHIAAKEFAGVLTLHSIYFLPVLALLMIEYYRQNTGLEVSKSKAKKLLFFLSPKFIIVLICISIYSNILFANQMYVYKDLHYKGTEVLMTRVLDRIEKLDSYTPGETEVVIIGLPHENKYFDYSSLLRMYDPKNQIFAKNVISYWSTWSWYINDLLGMQMKISADIEEYKNSDFVKEMPIFPHKDSVQMIDGNVIVKISN